MSLTRATFTTVIASAAVCAGAGGMRPRPLSEYPARQSVNGFTLAATVLTADQVKRQFSADLNRNYVVIEVAVFPDAGLDVTMSPADFTARFGSSSDSRRPEATDAIAAHLANPGAPAVPGGAQIYSSGTVGYERGPNGRSGVYVSTSSEVAIAPPTPPVQGTDPGSIEQHLDALSLPAEPMSQPTAGYLYFMRPAKGKVFPLHLTLYGSQGSIELSIPGR